MGMDRREIVGKYKQVNAKIRMFVVVRSGSEVRLSNAAKENKLWN